ncbi:MAG: hypothetical protein IJ341_12805 [Bacteroidales bacterium]|nr:hypothetical protein [Bacteroidales bacterium]
MIQLPYLIHCDKGNLSFSYGERLDSRISEKVDSETLRQHLINLFNKCGDATNDVEVDGMIVRWTMRYGKLSPRRCWCELEKNCEIYPEY